MAELKFQKLTPTRDADLMAYEEAIEYIFSQDDIRNVAFAGAYSSGKSSVIESYKKEHKDKRFMHLSLAHFQKEEVGIAPNDNDAEPKESEAVIEGKILNQLIQQIPTNAIPQTNFRIKRNVGKRSAVLSSVAVCIFAVALIHCIRFSSWQCWLSNLDEGMLKNLLLVTATPGAYLFSAFLSLALMGTGIYQIIRIQHNKNILRKVSVQGNEIEIFSDSEESYFDKYLNEVLYLFENADVDVIVFEDIDRFNNVTIFERLREINTLTNARLSETNKGNEKKTIRFFYLLRDDVFENKDRIKFFDFIVPIVPVLDSSNSYNKIKQYLGEAGLLKKFDDRFLRGISLYIDDLRLVKNIYNEFLIYYTKLNGIELDENKMFAIIAYKNIFPRDFADLQLNKGFVHTLFNSKEDFIASRTESIKTQISDINAELQLVEDEFLETIQELDDVKEAKQNRSRYYPEAQKYRDWLDNEYPKRKAAIESKSTNDVDLLKENLNKLNNDLETINNSDLKDLLTRDSIDDAFAVSYVNEIGKKDEFLDVKGSQYFALLKYLISRGYIDESYSDYMTFFYPNSLSLGDKVFLRSVTDRKSKPYGYSLDSPKLVAENLDPYDFTQPETLNFDLIEFILADQRTDLINNFIAQLQSDKRFDFIIEYMKSEKDIIPFILAITNNWPSMFYEALSGGKLPEDFIKAISYVIVNSSEKTNLQNININSCLTEYISSDPKYITNENLASNRAGESLKALNVSFTEIDSSAATSVLFDYVYNNNLYVVNDGNIEMMLRHKCNIDDISHCLKNLFTYLKNNQELPLSRYLLGKVEVTMRVYLDMYQYSILDDNETVVDIINDEDIPDDLKEKYVSRLDTKVTDLTDINDPSMYKVVINNKSLEYTAINVLTYYSEYGLTEELISFINSETKKLDYKDEGKEHLIDSFSVDCIKCDSLTNEKYEQIVCNLYDQIVNFNILGLSTEKLNVLIENDIITMNNNNLTFIRSNYADCTLGFIRHNVQTYIDLMNSSSIVHEELQELLTWPEIDDQQKIGLLKQNHSKKISVTDKCFSSELLQYILENNFDPTDMPWVLKTYDNQDEKVRLIIRALVRDNVDVAITNSQYMSYSLLKSLLLSQDVVKSEKTKLIEAKSKDLDKDELCTILIALGADKIADNISGGTRKVEITQEHEGILNALYSGGVIKKYEKAADGKYYKKIRYKK